MAYKTPLQHVPDSAVAAVEGLRVHAVELPQRLGQVTLGGLQQQVIWILIRQ